MRLIKILLIFVILVAGCKQQPSVPQKATPRVSPTNKAGTKINVQRGLDPKALQNTIRKYLKKSDTTPKMKIETFYGIQSINSTSAKAFFKIGYRYSRRKSKPAFALYLYLVNKGWYLKRIQFGSGIGTQWWDNIWLRVEGSNNSQQN